MFFTASWYRALLAIWEGISSTKCENKCDLRHHGTELFTHGFAIDFSMDVAFPAYMSALFFAFCHCPVPRSLSFRARWSWQRARPLSSRKCPPKQMAARFGMGMKKLQYGYYTVHLGQALELIGTQHFSLSTQEAFFWFSKKQPLAATCPGANGCKWLQVAAGSKWLQVAASACWEQVAASACWEQVAASGCKWLQSGCKWLQVAASGCKWLQVQETLENSQHSPVGASGCKWLPGASGCKWLRVAASGCWDQVAASGCNWLLGPSGCKWLQVQETLENFQLSPVEGTGEFWTFSGGRHRRILNILRWEQVAASGCREQVAASGCKWLRVAASGCKWLQVAVVLNLQSSWMQACKILFRFGVRDLVLWNILGATESDLVLNFRSSLMLRCQIAAWSCIHLGCYRVRFCP